MEAETYVRHEAIRSEIYKLLAECYYTPDKALSGKITDLVEKLRLAGLQARQDINWGGKKFLKVGNIEELKVEYARLFVGPYTLLAPPYGSVYLEPERRIMGNSTMDVINRYRQSGLVVADDFKDAPDHIAAELEFMHFLIFKAVEAAGQDDGDQVVASLINQQSFLEIHLGAWVHEFADKVIQNAAISFYRNLARATETFIKDDYQVISSVLTSGSSDPENSAEIESISGHC